jgi:hypothetical protein
VQVGSGIRAYFDFKIWNGICRYLRRPQREIPDFDNFLQELFPLFKNPRGAKQARIVLNACGTQADAVLEDIRVLRECLEEPDIRLLEVERDIRGAEPLLIDCY